MNPHVTLIEQLRKSSTAVYAVMDQDVAVDISKTLREAANALEWPPKNTISGRPKIVAISGSTRFLSQMSITAWEYEKLGNITLGCHLLPESYCGVPDHFAEVQGVAEQMDELHLRKIDLCDWLHVVNVDGYIGESTAREIEYATSIGKHITYQESLVPNSTHDSNDEWQKIPIITKAFFMESFPGSSSECPDWVLQAIHSGVIREREDGFEINTLSGPIVTPYKNWVIRRNETDIYPCENSVFIETYQRPITP